MLRERQRQTERERERERDDETLCVRLHGRGRHEIGGSVREGSFSYVWSCQVGPTIFNLFTTILLNTFT